MRHIRLFCLAAVISIAFSQAAFSETAYNFGDWRIERHKISDGTVAHSLIGVGRSNDINKEFVGLKFINLKCFAKGVEALFFPFDLKPEKRKKMPKSTLSADAYYWIDNHRPNKIPMKMLNSLFYASLNKSDIRGFFSSITKANETFSFTLKSKNIVFDVKNLKAAATVFKKICQKN